ncbi:MAG: hypothetical protein ACI4VN_06465 [Clostridia bacterium]|nr:hypothetical protein [Clostridia bacterium]
MLEEIREIAHLLDVDPFWIWLLIGLLVLLVIVKCMYPWKPKWKSKKTKDKDGNEITTYYHLDI